ncbi:MAG: hypothetical protein CBC71_08430 [Rhodobacteraceae bacterium TMED111]|nr:hypothetical protein [Marinovum sp.]OUV40097.1 MAG: hypothetical protein CBC71_08430 [Rhodobacteraceae bacterium TMED111]|tara:strand:+ start:5362 stop:5982 length:621 start_codon:yes stop_codon:yes gene_type:complete
MVNRHNFGKLGLSLIGTFTKILFVLALSSSQSLANTKQNCNTNALTNETPHCDTKFEVIAGLNKDFQKVYGFGSVSSISQPPLVIMPEIAFAAPTVSDESLDTKDSTKKIIRPISAQRKSPSSDLNLINIVNVLDKKGSRHLSKCLKKLSYETKETYFSNFKKELEILEEISTKPSNKSGLLAAVLSRSPSRQSCINYLDFILMAS